MRPSSAAFAVSLLAGAMVGASATAALAPPPIANNTPFAAARAELATAGFVPAYVIKSGKDCPTGGCRSSQPIACYASLGSCRWLFIDRANDALYFVDVFMEPRRRGPSRAHFEGIRLAPQEELEWESLEVVLPNGVHRRFSPPPPRPLPPDRPAPLCSEVPPHTLPCWVKPPTGYRRGQVAPR